MHDDVPPVVALDLGDVVTDVVHESEIALCAEDVLERTANQRRHDLSIGPREVRSSNHRSVVATAGGPGEGRARELPVG
jgi:hypothetical protein